ncbi:radial spoke head protein 3 homolog B-like [Genypterus blacodes]|uniref:radial spoke head protein 3 homolog B-like n=1 Tax=Genypterus blacodes TaxID=154954 RepID=UPI003F76FBCD
MAFQKDCDGQRPPSLSSGQPRIVENRSSSRKTQSQQSHDFPFVNIMYDRRVVRGNTRRVNMKQLLSQPDVPKIQRQQEIRRKAVPRKRSSDQTRVLRTPKSLQGRKHVDVQTEYYLEELNDVIDTNNIDCQTDAFLDRPSTPLFTPPKFGENVGTQIEEGELFDFDREVQPSLEVLVVKTMEQALLEVMEEEELACLRAQQRAFHEVRNAELAEVHRLEQQERRRNEEKESRYAQQRETLQKEKEVVEKISAVAYTQQYMADLVPEVFTSLKSHGYLSGDAVKKDIETNFVPWLMAEVNSNMEMSRAARELLDMVIYTATQN